MRVDFNHLILLGFLVGCAKGGCKDSVTRHSNKGQTLTHSCGHKRLAYTRSVPHVYLAGDIERYPNSFHHAILWKLEGGHEAVLCYYYNNETTLSCPELGIHAKFK